MTTPPPPPPPPPPSRRPRRDGSSQIGGGTSANLAGGLASGSTPAAAAFRKTVAVAGRVKGVFLIITLLVLYAAAFFIAPLLGATFEREGLKVDGVPGLFFSQPWIVLPLSIPAVITAIALVRGVRRPFRWMSVSTVFLLIPTAFVLAGVLGGWMQLLDRAMGGR
ncbi:MAG: hypothetical protein ACKO3W_15315 [bacterium]